MNSRERVLAAVEHEEPDRVPVDLGSTVTGVHKRAYENLKRHLGVESETVLYDMMQQLALVDESVLRRFDIDTRHIRSSFSKEPKKMLPDGSYIDSWGVKRVKTGYYYDMPSDGHPLRNISIDDVDEYSWLDPYENAEKAIEYMEKRVKYLHEATDYTVVYSSSGGFFEKSWYLTGFQRFFTDLIRNPIFCV